MAESTLSLSYTDFKEEVGYFLGYGRTSGNWSASQLSIIDKIVQSGIRRVYYPPILGGENGAHRWSWIHPNTTLAIVSGTGDYDLPDDFGTLVGGFHYAPDEQYAMIAHIPVARILEMRARSDYSGFPMFVGTRFKAGTFTVGQRQEALFYPEPDASWTLHYEYDAYTGALTDTLLYPLGGMELSELYLESCLAVAEQRISQEASIHTQAFQSLVRDAIMRDRKRGPQNFGRMGEPEAHAHEWRRGYSGSTYPLTYKGQPVT